MHLHAFVYILHAIPPNCRKWPFFELLLSIKNSDCILWVGKVFTPSNFFTPPFDLMKIRKVEEFENMICSIKCPKKGVKNFFMIKSNVSAFSWTKNHTFIWQTHSYSSDQTTAAKSHLGGAIWGISFNGASLKREECSLPWRPYIEWMVANFENMLSSVM